MGASLLRLWPVEGQKEQDNAVKLKAWALKTATKYENPMVILSY